MAEMSMQRVAPLAHELLARFGPDATLRVTSDVLASALAEVEASRRLHAIQPRPPVFDYLLVKLAARCNLDCTYCYWFRDLSVYEKPKTLTSKAEGALLDKLERHIRRHQLTRFSILFHGGEPLLFGKRRFARLLTSLAAVDDDWARLLSTFGVRPTVSIDGPPAVHDAARVDRGGRGTHARVVAGLQALRAQGLSPRVLAVCDPQSEPRDVTKHIVEDLDVRTFDILVPDATHDDEAPPIAAYYKRLFDLWYDEYAARGISIRYPRALLVGLLGGHARFEPIGYGPVQVCTVVTDGGLEPLDVLRIGSHGTTGTQLNIIEHDFQEVTLDPTWSEAFHASLNLCDVCDACEYRLPCGGGFLPHRLSSTNGYDNPSVYCRDLKDIFRHIGRRVIADLKTAAHERSGK
jgi:uncharacterized protein